MERELKGNEKAIDDIGDEMGDADKETNRFGDEQEDPAREADSSGGKLEKLGSVVNYFHIAVLNIQLTAPYQ